jgi:hypothetical protein
MATGIHGMDIVPQLSLSQKYEDIGTFGMVFKRANPIWEVLALLPDTAISAANDNFAIQDIGKAA